MMQEFEEDYYEILGVEETASGDEIRKAYLALAKKLHPDRHPNDAEMRAKAQKEFARVTRAHDVVNDVERRAEYDALRLLKRKKDQDEMNSMQSGESLEVGAVDGTTLRMSPVGAAGATARDSLTGMSSEDNINVKWANKHLARADDLLRKRRYQEAETAMKEAIRLVPKEARYHNKLAEIYLARRWNTLALTEVQTALRVDPRDSDARSLEARIRNAIKEQEETRNRQKGKKGFFEQLKEILTKKI